MSDAEITQPQAGALDRARTLLARGLATAGGRGGALVILLALVVAFSLAADNFLTVDNLRNILRQYSVPAILAVGQTIVIVSAGIDLSVASTAALSGSVMGVTYAHEGYPEPVALLLGQGEGDEDRGRRSTRDARAGRRSPRAGSRWRSPCPSS